MQILLLSKWKWAYWKWLRKDWESKGPTSRTETAELSNMNPNLYHKVKNSLQREFNSQMGWLVKSDLLVIMTTFGYLYVIGQIYYIGCIDFIEKSPVMLNRFILSHWICYSHCWNLYLNLFYRGSENFQNLYLSLLYRGSENFKYNSPLDKLG